MKDEPLSIKQISSFTLLQSEQNGEVNQSMSLEMEWSRVGRIDYITICLFINQGLPEFGFRNQFFRL